MNSQSSSVWFLPMANTPEILEIPNIESFRKRRKVALDEQFETIKDAIAIEFADADFSEDSVILDYQHYACPPIRALIVDMFVSLGYSKSQIVFDEPRKVEIKFDDSIEK